MKMLSNQPARLRLTAAVLLIAVLAGAVALMRGNPAQSKIGRASGRERVEGIA